jgi:2-dehydro-3-deoxyphosphogluconate aldolase/(4S)-4-hydroxy-2-oxoglutarate aldolase
MPTGGVEVDEANIGAWFKSGVCAVGMGSKLISKELMEQKDYRAIADLTKKALHIIKKLS